MAGTAVRLGTLWGQVRPYRWWIAGGIVGLFALLFTWLVATAPLGRALELAGDSPLPQFATARETLKALEGGGAAAAPAPGSARPPPAPDQGWARSSWWGAGFGGGRVRFGAVQ